MNSESSIIAIKKNKYIEQDKYYKEIEDDLIKKSVENKVLLEENKLLKKGIAKAEKKNIYNIEKEICRNIENGFDETDTETEFKIEYLSETEEQKYNKYKWESGKIYLPWDKKWVYPKDHEKYESPTEYETNVNKIKTNKDFNFMMRT